MDKIHAIDTSPTRKNKTEKSLSLIGCAKHDRLITKDFRAKLELLWIVATIVAVLDATASAVSAASHTILAVTATTITQKAISKNYENVTKS